MSSMPTLPRQNSHPNPYASQAYTRRGGGSSSSSGSAARFPRMLKRLFKFPQMDFEVAIWEMTTLLIAPKKVFKNMYYHKQTKQTYASSDPAFPYLLAFFLLLTSLAWSLAYAAPTAPNILRIALVFVLVHCLLACLLTATAHYLAVTRLFSPRGYAARLPGARSGGGSARGLFALPPGDPAEQLEWGFCFDVALRAFLPLLLDLYIVQFVLLPLLARRNAGSVVLSNALHVVAGAHALYINWLGYASLPFLHGTHLMLVPGLVGLGVFWVVASLSGWNASLHLAPVLWCAGGLRKAVGGG